MSQLEALFQSTDEERGAGVLSGTLVDGENASHPYAVLASFPIQEPVDLVSGEAKPRVVCSHFSEGPNRLEVEGGIGLG